MSHWPLQSEADNFYGNPRGRSAATVSQTWYKKNIIMLVPPFKMKMVQPILRFPIHKKCADATRAWLEQVWINAGRDQRVIEQWGMNVF